MEGFLDAELAYVRVLERQGRVRVLEAVVQNGRLRLALSVGGETFAPIWLDEGGFHHAGSSFETVEALLSTMSEPFRTQTMAELARRLAGSASRGAE